MFSGSCEPAREHADTGDQEPSLGAGDGDLEVLGEAAVCAENLNPSVAMMQAAQDRVCSNQPDPLNRTRDRRILVQ